MADYDIESEMDAYLGPTGLCGWCAEQKATRYVYDVGNDDLSPCCDSCFVLMVRGGYDSYTEIGE